MNPEELNTKGRSLSRGAYSLWSQKKLEDALILFQSSLQAFKQAYKIEPNNRHYELNVADSYLAMGQIAQQLGKIDETTAYVEEGKNLVERVRKEYADSNHLAQVIRRHSIYFDVTGLTSE
ncbi:MAG: hypothetical protein KJ583_05640 [Nanoarchaeota archaeon]|nr:hypothetical protein [Nanoarchaeota archaeon]MBU1604773.1 hypothetical protein [Nanoarchaeota archaeon]MBU2443493.1 hypothetical protein [Nanoarchaeota archaeon]